MENPKDRGRKHLRNKNKYKSNKSKATTTTVDANKPKKCEKLESNWDRYDDNKLDASPVRPGMDFAVLANKPITRGSHFSFKNKRDESDLSETNELFNLDLTLLERSLSCIAFNERSDINLDYFSEQQKSVIQKKSQDNQRSYDDYLENYRKIVSLNKNEDEVIEDKSSDGGEEEDSLLGIVENLDNLDLSSQSTAVKAESKGGTDLEKWLDDILDS